MGKVTVGFGVGDGCGVSVGSGVGERWGVSVGIALGRVNVAAWVGVAVGLGAQPERRRFARTNMMKTVLKGFDISKENFPSGKNASMVREIIALLS